MMAMMTARRAGKTAALAVLINAALDRLAAEARDVAIAATDDALRGGTGTGIVFVSGDGRALRIPPEDFRPDLSSDLSRPA